LGWGVLGSTLPVRFPESLRVPDCAVTPFAVQPGQVLMPENCAVALRIDGPYGSWVGVWRPAGRRVDHLPAPLGWLAGAGLWTPEGVLRLPYTTRETPCGVAELTAPKAEAAARCATSAGSRDADPRGAVQEPEGTAGEAPGMSPRPAEPGPAEPAQAEPAEQVTARPVPLQQAPLGRLVTN
jgi:hypothetical protein